MPDTLSARPTSSARRAADRPLPDRVRSVCLYTPSADPSGMGAHLLDLAAEQVTVGADVSVMAWPTAPGRRLLARAAEVGARALPLPHPRDPRFGDTVQDLLRRHPADVFHLHVGTGREDFDGARAARRAGVPLVLQTLHLPWRMRDHRKIARLHASLAPVDHLIAVSQAQRETYERVGVPSAAFTTVPNGIRERGPGPGRAAARDALGLDADQPVVLTVGRLNRMKGQRHLVDAVPALAARFPRLAVVVIGDGHLRAALQAQVDALGVGAHVRLAGHRTDARGLLDAADVFVLPSLHEGMPLAALEAMEVGLPVVATRVVGTSEVVADGETGTLVRPRDPAALARALGDLLADEDRRQEQGAAGRERYRTLFTATRMAEETAAVYAAQLVRRRSAR